MIKRTPSLALVLLTSLFGMSQDSLFTGSGYKMYSDILKEERTISISLPQTYNSKKYTPANYPVLYVLDGETSFEYVSSIVTFLSKGVYAHIPEMIVVDIYNTNRTRDLTPTESSLKSLFAGFWFDFKKITADNNLLETHYKTFSNDVSHEFKPAESKLDSIVKYLKENSKKAEALATLRVYQKLYPKTAPISL